VNKWFSRLHLLRGKKHRGGGTQYKGELVPQDTYQWSFVLIQRSGKNQWVFSLYTRPNDKDREPYWTFKFYGNDRDAIEKGTALNQAEQEKYDKKIAKLRARKQQQHDQLAKRREGGHRPGPINECPICRPTRRRGQ
jgi:hypothetical protein